MAIITNTHYTAPQNKSIQTFGCNSGNRITKDYYNWLVGAINNDLVYRVVCRVENKTFGTELYYLVSDK